MMNNFPIQNTIHICVLNSVNTFMNLNMNPNGADIEDSQNCVKSWRYGAQEVACGSDYLDP